jgi:hypothetical protein
MIFIHWVHVQVKEVIAKEPNLPVPMHIRNAPTKLMKVQSVCPSMYCYNVVGLMASACRILDMELGTSITQTTRSQWIKIISPQTCPPRSSWTRIEGYVKSGQPQKVKAYPASLYESVLYCRNTHIGQSKEQERK